MATDLFKDLKIEETAKKAGEKISEYIRFKRIAGEIEKQELTNDYFLQKRKVSEEDSQVKKLALEEIYDIEEAVSRVLDPVQRELLMKRYLSKDSEYIKDWDIYANDLNVSHSTYYDIRKKAFISFAESYKNGALLVF